MTDWSQTKLDPGCKNQYILGMRDVAEQMAKTLKPSGDEKAFIQDFVKTSGKAFDDLDDVTSTKFEMGLKNMISQFKADEAQWKKDQGNEELKQKVAKDVAYITGAIIVAKAEKDAEPKYAEFD